MIEPTKRKIIFIISALLIFWLAWVALSRTANAQNDEYPCKRWQSGTVELQTSPKATQYIVPIEYGAEFCGEAVLVVTEQGVDTGLAVVRSSAYSTQDNGTIQVEIDPKSVAPNGVVVLGWVGVSDDGQ